MSGLTPLRFGGVSVAAPRADDGLELGECGVDDFTQMILAQNLPLRQEVLAIHDA
jgi:hypothetical protein